ncbi:MAG: response regulator [Saprospirales bacterium]|nr:response regulator [Saprospirales bacterium]
MARIASFLTPAFLTLFLATAVAQEEPTFRFDLFELPHGEEGNHVQSIAQDSFGFIWFGSRHGLHRWDGYQFKTYVFKPYDANSLSSNYIEYIYVARDGSLWIGAWGGGLSHFNPKTEVFTRYKHIPENPASLSNDFVSEILEDRQGYLWVATLQGLNRLDPTTGQFRRFVHDPYNPFSLSYDKCRTLYLDSDGVLWVGAGWIWETDQGGGLNRFDPKSETFTRYLHDRRNPKSLVSNKVSEIFEDSKGNFWVGTEGDGLHLMDRKTGAFTRMENSPERAEKLSSPLRRNTPEGHVRFILEDRDRDLWVGAWGGGIKYYDPASGYIRHFHAGQPFPTVPDNSVWRLIQSKDGAFWGCTAGEPGRVFRVLKVKEKVDEKREVEAIEFLSPPDIGDRFSELPPKARITDFQLLDQPGNEKANPFLPEDFWEKPELSLRYDQNMFTFRFTAMDFTQPENNLYEFQLVGYDKFWRKSGLEPLANYVKVPPGDYTFRVRAANTDGIWGEPVSVRLFISAPWWATWWAYAGYILLAIALILGIYRFMLNRRLEQAEARRLRELDTVKTQLYTNITHEFRTPLTVILGMARQALESPKENFRQSQEMIIRNGENLLSLVNQLLDLSRLESGKMGLRLERGDVLAYLKYLLESFHSFAESRQVQIHFLSEEEALTMDYDPAKLQQIVLNLLSNAVKFTPAGGHVYVQCSVASPSVSVGSGDDFLLLKVKDTGKGIPAGHLPYIFDRFYQADDSNTKERGGSGIGLALTKELVQLMGGDISVKSREGHGTEVAVSLPIRLARETRPAQAMFLQPLIAKPISPLPEKPALAPALSPEPETDTGNPTILIVEDHADVVQFLSSCLADSYRIKIANDGQEGIDIALETVPDLIISDVMMPRKDGFELCQVLKNDERTSHIPIVMLTAKADMESKLEGLECGADAYLAKPFLKEELLIRIRKLIELRRKLQGYYLASAGLGERSAATKDIPKMEEMEDYFVKKVRRAVEANIENYDFSVEQLCREIGMSNSQLHRKLSALTGFSATKFIRYVRLSRAKELLRNPDLSITAVAFDSGFNDPSYFGRVFKAEFGQTPVEWRVGVEPQSFPPIRQ